MFPSSSMDRPSCAHGDDEKPPRAGEKPPAVPTRTRWAELIARAFGGLDPRRCHECGGEKEVLAVIRDRGEARRYLEAADLHADLAAQSRARAPP